MLLPVFACNTASPPSEIKQHVENRPIERIVPDPRTNSIQGEWALIGRGDEHGPILRFDDTSVTIHGTRYAYIVKDDSLTILTQYADHIGDGNSTGVISKLAEDTMKVEWSDGGRDRYVKIQHHFNGPDH
ncbi:MAG: hypothetical protein R2818_14660 [Flavobacteriales bacterium]